MKINLSLVPKLVTSAKTDYFCAQVAQNLSWSNQAFDKTGYFGDISEHKRYNRDFHAEVNFFREDMA